jgi:hypothetical protein
MNIEQQNIDETHDNIEVSDIYSDIQRYGEEWSAEEDSYWFGD